MQETKRLLEIMAKLRDPNGGCPWDVEQNFATIAPYTLEEAYEVADAIERDDMTALKEELGDLLLQVVFHSQMAEEAGLFNFEQVAAGINEKMISRHPHVFGEQTGIKSADDQVDNWDAIKAEEKKSKGHISVMDDIPVSFPALLRAQKLGKKASKQGFDWPELAPVFDKVQEEIAELNEAIANKDEANIEEELGDLLFAVVNVARHVKVDAETALRKANTKFEKRFRLIEPDITDDSTLEEMEALWVEAKKAS
ncbi:MAG: nucleoside triphosphate pyrophosphohydrolase [Rickettsiales bacterium]|nr:nucleoside triphosphate pyrophosphohydrolase [Rickettsiales bacterium]